MPRVDRKRIKPTKHRSQPRWTFRIIGVYRDTNGTVLARTEWRAKRRIAAAFQTKPSLVFVDRV